MRTALKNRVHALIARQGIGHGHTDLFGRAGNAALERIAKRRGRQVAKVAIARKMLTLCYYGLRDGEIRCLNVPDRRSR
jgi:hypothetical protein